MKLGLSFTTGKKLSLGLNKKEKQQSYIITGFGYSMMEFFENDTVPMEFVVKNEMQEEIQSPFHSPKKKARTKEELRRKRREQKKRIKAEFERI